MICPLPFRPVCEEAVAVPEAAMLALEPLHQGTTCMFSHPTSECSSSRGLAEDTFPGLSHVSTISTCAPRRSHKHQRALCRHQGNCLLPGKGVLGSRGRTSQWQEKAGPWQKAWQLSFYPLHSQPFSLKGGLTLKTFLGTSAQTLADGQPLHNPFTHTKERCLARAIQKCGCPPGVKATGAWPQPDVLGLKAAVRF